MMTTESQPVPIGPNSVVYETRERAAIRQANAIKARKESKRRRKIDPTTCERVYSDREIEFMNAIQDYKRTSGRMFPTWSEILEVLEKLGYAKQNLAS